jgi:predicted ArsR family transcriptional regulator
MKYHHTLEPDEAKRRIEEYIYKHPGSKTSEITDSLRINPEQAMDILNDLKKEGRYIILSNILIEDPIRLLYYSIHTSI